MPFPESAIRQRFLFYLVPMAVGQTLASLNTQILKAFPLPSRHSTNKLAIAAVLTDMDAELAALERPQQDPRPQASHDAGTTHRQNAACSHRRFPCLNNPAPNADAEPGYRPVHR